MQGKTFNRSLVALAVAGAFATGAFVADRVGISVAHANSPATAAVTAPVAGATTALPDFADLVAKHGPAVVQISVSQNAEKVSAQGGPGGPDFGHMFPDFPGFPGFHNMPQTPDQAPTRGVGSGFIVSPDGIILTNAHVVDDAKEVTVRLTDKREFKAKVLGMDKLTDVAVLKIDAKNLPTVTHRRSGGDSQSRRMGGRDRLAVRVREHRHRRASSAPSRARCRATPTCRSSRPTSRSIPATRAARCSTCKGEVIGINSQIFSRTRRLSGPVVRHPDRRRDERARTSSSTTAKVARGRIGVTIQERQPGAGRLLRPDHGRPARWSSRCRRTAPRPRPASSRAT